MKTRTADFRAHTRSLTLAVPTEDLDEIIAASRSVMPHPEESGAVRLVGVSLSGLTEERQGALFPELSEIGTRETVHPDPPEPEGVTATDPHGPWRATQDVQHAEFGHGWVQGTGGGVVSVRFETRATGPGRTRTFPVDDPDLSPADPLESLAWDPPAAPPADTAVPSGPEQG